VGLTQRGTRHFSQNAHVDGRVLVLRQIAESLVDGRLVLTSRLAYQDLTDRVGRGTLASQSAL
jgi:hypothetical protein